LLTTGFFKSISPKNQAFDRAEDRAGRSQIPALPRTLNGARSFGQITGLYRFSNFSNVGAKE